jgi:hypothetical protein
VNIDGTRIPTRGRRPVCVAAAALLALVIVLPGDSAAAQQEPARSVTEVRRWRLAEARQAPAVDGEFVYAIDNRRIGKYDRRTGEKVAEWVGDEDGPIIHLNAGIVLDGVLYATHSNYPALPMLSSLELFDAGTLQHVGSHSFGFQPGSATWVDRKDGSWWVGYANYEGQGGDPARPPAATRVVRYDSEWREVESFAFPPEVVARFGTRSNSGASWGPDGMLYATGHDHPELYVLRLPEMGSVLELAETIPVPAEGQGIAWDRARPGTLLTLIRSEATIVESRMTGWQPEAGEP